MLNRLFAYVIGLLSRRRANAEADDELAFHVEHETAANVARGMSRAEARRVALRDLGGLTQTAESIRGVRMVWIDSLWRDVRYAVRTLRRTPAFTLSVLATLALVIGANGAAFSLADAILLRPLPYPQPERLASVAWHTQSSTSNTFGGAVDGSVWEGIRDTVAALDVAAAHAGRDRINFNTDDTAAFVVQARVSAGYFHVIGVAPLVGRAFTVDEDRPGGAPVVVLSHDFRTRAFQTDASIVGRTLFLRGEAYQVVGVMPPGFAPMGPPADLFTPLRPSRRGEGGGNNYHVTARLRDGYTWSDADGQLRNVEHDLLSSNETSGVTRRLATRPLQDALAAGARTPIQMLVGAGILVLLIACVNLAALLLARGDARRQEIAARLALGSSRAAIIRQLAMESLLLGVAGGALGIVVAHGCLAMLQTLGDDIFTQWAAATIDVRVVVVTGAISILTAVVFGFAPAVTASRVDVRAALSSGGSRAIAGGASRWGRRLLIATEVALSVVLLVVAGLFARTLANLDGLDPGFNPSGLVTTSVSLQDARYASAERVNQLFDVSLDALMRTPAVESAAVSLGLPYSTLLNSGFRFADRLDNQLVSNFMYITPAFFDTLGIPLRSGRTFTPADSVGQPPVVIVNDAFVRYVAGDEDPTGRHLRFNNHDWRVVGIVGDVQTRGSGPSFQGMVRGPIEAPPIVFFPAAQLSDAFAPIAHQWFMPSWTVRLSAAVNAEVVFRRAIDEADALLPLTPVMRLSDLRAEAAAFQRLLLTLIGAFAAVALLLAAIGIYGLIAQTILERTREIGIRMALGATSSGTIRRVTMSGVTVAGVGIVAGMALAYGATRFVVSLLWGVDRHDPLTFAAIAALLLVVAALASVLPALRIVRINPAKILRG